MEEIKREFVCIVCPNGCQLEVTTKGDEITVDGADCKRGIPFGNSEMTQPMRGIASTVATEFEDFPLLPVRTKKEIKKQDIAKAMEAINAVLIKTRVKTGDVVAKNVCGTDIVATSDMTLVIPNERFK